MKIIDKLKKEKYYFQDAFGVYNTTSILELFKKNVGYNYLSDIEIKKAIECMNSSTLIFDLILQTTLEKFNNIKYNKYDEKEHILKLFSYIYNNINIYYDEEGLLEHIINDNSGYSLLEIMDKKNITEKDLNKYNGDFADIFINKILEEYKYKKIGELYIVWRKE